ncbi:type II secretion system protein N [Sphingorhabdus sp.]|uniref:type II secretion system protein N n=2 Tax=Sphingorhabdus sp. TaxID=1902408 RepID=UPI002FD9AB53
MTLAERVKVQSHKITAVPAGRLILGVLAILTAVQTARFFWILITPVGPVNDWRAPSVNIVPQSARMALFAGFDPFFRNDAAADSTQNVTSLSLTLFGVRTNESSGGGSAIIAGEDGVQNSFAIGEEVAPGVTLDSVAFDHVILSRGGVKESLYLDQSVPAETVSPPASGSAVTTPTTSGGGVGLNADTLQKSIGFAPRNEGGRVTGLVLQARDDGTMLRLAGFQAGDIVVGINGRPVSSAADIASQIRPGARLSVEVERGGAKVPIALNLEQQ